MVSHANFILTLIELIEFAEQQGMDPAAQALTEAAERIAPSLAIARQCAEATGDSSGKVIILRQHRRG